MLSKQQIALNYDVLKEVAEEHKIPFTLTLNQYRALFKARKCALSGKAFDELYPGFSQCVALLEPSKGFVKGNVIIVLELLASSDPQDLKPIDMHLRDMTFELSASHADLQKSSNELNELKETLAKEDEEAKAAVDSIGLKILSNEADREELSVATAISLSSIEAVEKAKVEYAKLVKPSWIKRVFGKK